LKTTSYTEDLRRRVRSLEGLPPMPGSLERIWRALQNPDAPARELASAVAADAAITARVLRMANSTYYALNRPVSDVCDATVALGFETVKSIALGASVVDAFRGRLAGFDLRGFWRHSVETGVSAECVARVARGTPPGTAFCAGVLHDVGKLALISVLGADAAEVFEDPRENVEREYELFGANHALAGLWLGQRWKFSPELLDAIAFHHAPAAAGESRRLAATVALAELVFVSLETADPPESPVAFDPMILDMAGVDAAGVETIRTRLPERLTAAEPMMESAR
jgi:HD-like signal output (HDOD) protein